MRWMVKNLSKLHDGLLPKLSHFSHNWQHAWLVCQSVNVSLNRVIQYKHFIWKEYNVHDLQPARKKNIKFALLHHPRWIIHRNWIMLQLYHPLNTSMCKFGEVSSDAYVSEWERERRERIRGRWVMWLEWMVRTCGKEQRKWRGGSDTKPLQFHILVCQTSAFLPNPFTESLIIPPCCSSSLCLIVSLADSLCYVCLSFVYLFVMFSLCLKWPQSLYLSLSQPYGSIQFNSSQIKSNQINSIHLAPNHKSWKVNTLQEYYEYY